MQETIALFDVFGEFHAYSVSLTLAIEYQACLSSL